MAVLVGWNCCSVTGSCTAASPAGVAAGSVLCSCIGCRSATGRRLVAGDTSVGGGIVSAGYRDTEPRRRNVISSFDPATGLLPYHGARDDWSLVYRRKVYRDFAFRG